MLLLVAASLTACGDESTNSSGGPQHDPQPAAEARGDVVLIVDGMEITAQEVHAFDESLRAFHPAVGRDTLARHVLTTHVLPLRAAQRAFADERADLAREALAYSQEVQGDGYPGLAATGPMRGGYRAERKPRGNLSLPLQEWAFAKERLYAVSPPLEVPEGFQVAAAYEFHDSISSGTEMVDVYVVPFMVLGRDEFAQWWEAERARLATRCTWVRSDHRHALPTWLQPPAPSRR